MKRNPTPPLAPLTQHISQNSNECWAVHIQAMQRRRRGEDVIVLSIGEDLAAETPEAIVSAAKESLDSGRHHYAPCTGELCLRELIIQRHKQRTGQTVDPDACVVFAGAQNALFATSLCLLQTGDDVIVPEPYYATYPATLSAAGAQLVTLPTTAQHGFQPDPDALAATISDKSKAIVLNSPNNPSGAVYSRDCIEAVAELCLRHDLWLISDEVYADLVFEGEFFSPASIPTIADRCVTLSSLSKSHWMAGWRVGWAIAPQPLADAFDALTLCMLYGLPPFIQDAAQTALMLPEAAVQQARDLYRDRRDLVCARLARIPGLQFCRPQGGMFVFADVRAVCPDASEFAFGLLDQYAVSVLPADGFGTSGAGHVRIGLTADSGILNEACDRIADYVAGLGATPAMSASGNQS